EADPAAGQIKVNGLYHFIYDTGANASAGAWILTNPSYIGQSKVISTTRDVTAAGGAVAYTGVGFKPTRLQIRFFVIGAGLGGSGQAYSDSSSPPNVAFNAFFTDVTTHQGGTSNIVYYSNSTGTTQQTAVLTSYDSDGFTLTWTKTGSPGAATLTM